MATVLGKIHELSSYRLWANLKAPDLLVVVDRNAVETASQIAGIRLWITNEYMHSGLRDGGGQVFDHLIGMLNGKKPLF